MVLVLVAVGYSYLNPAIDFVKTYTGATAAKEKRHELLRENKALHHRIQAAEEPLVMEQEGREQGMVAEGERAMRVRGLPR